MKKINIKDEKVLVESSEILNAISLKKSLQIDLDGKVYVDKEISNNLIVIYKHDYSENLSSLVDINATIKNVFKDYKPLIKGTKCELKPLQAWQKIIFYNQERMLYFDHQSDGIELFEDSILEDIGWNASACDIKYREISDFIESNCEGTLLFYDNEIQFNGFAIVEDIEDVREKVKAFVIEKIKEKIKEDAIDIEDDDIIEALEYFKLEV